MAQATPILQPTAGEALADIGRSYGVSHSTISRLNGGAGSGSILLVHRDIYATL
jgi:hypothetical protein